MSRVVSEHPLFPDAQFLPRPGILEMGSGQPDPSLLPVGGLHAAANVIFRERASSALVYGAEQGPGTLISRLAVWQSARDRVECDPHQLFVTAGASQGLDLACGLLTEPGDIALVEAPVYHLALRILHDRGLHLIPIPTDREGLSVEALQVLLADLRSRGTRARILYTVPTFANPTGLTLSIARRKALAAQADAHGLVVIEDDVYRSLWYDAPPPESLFDLSPIGSVVRLGSFSKVLAPGLRLGWLQADPKLVRQIVGCGLLDSGGGLNHFTAQVVAAYMELDLLDAHIERLRAVYSKRRDALIQALDRYLPDGCNWERPAGGFFVWLTMPEKIDTAQLLAEAEAAGVSYVPGCRFHVAGECLQQARLAFCRLEATELDEAVRRLGDVLTSAQR